jgi:hypothetical protein
VIAEALMGFNEADAIRADPLLVLVQGNEILGEHRLKAA